MIEGGRRQPNCGQAEILTLPDRYQFNPIHYPICARLPARRHVPSAWMGHVPFAMCLIDMVKPRVLVELGTHWGVSYCAFCQAVKELRLPTQCFAVDTWQGDPHASLYTPEVLQDLKSHHDERYRLFSRLIQATFDEVVNQFADKDVDLLHIDGYHAYDAVKHDFETWLPKMSDRGVVLFHDIEVRDQAPFGVWRFWDEIKHKHPHFAFYHSYGLGVLAVGQSIPDGLRPLVRLSESTGDPIRQYFANLGERLAALHSTAMQCQNLAELLQAEREEHREVLVRCAGLQDRCASLQDQCARLEQCVRDQTASWEASQAYQAQFRFRAVDWAAGLVSRSPVAYRALRFTVRGAARALRKVQWLTVGTAD